VVPKAGEGTATTGTARALILVWARPGSSRESVKWDQWRKRWAVSVTAPAQEGRANEAILELLAKTVGVSASCLVIRHGHTSASKTIEVLGLDQETADSRLRGDGTSRTLTQS
jgi:hypothetical protein